MPKEIRTVAGVIRALGGLHAVAKLTRRGPTAVHNWKALRRFSAPTYWLLTEALTERGFTASPKLWSMQQTAKKKSTAEAPADLAA